MLLELTDEQRAWYILQGYEIREYDACREFYLNDILHRDGGLAAECDDGGKEWFLNGQLHREDGPAVEGAKGDRLWYLNGKELTEEQHTKAVCEMKNGIT